MKRSYNDNKAFLDLLLNCLVGFVFLFMIAFMQIEPEAKDLEKPKAEYVITLTWPAEDPSDVDMWLEDPAGNLISFKEKAGGLTHLDRDDLGGAGDHFVLPDGRIIKYEYNQEIMTIRGFIPGEWTINIHMYNKKIKESTTALIRIDKLNPQVTTILNGKFVLEKHWQEITVIRFTMKMDGTIIAVHDMPVSLIQKHPDLASRMLYESQRGQVLPTPPPVRSRSDSVNPRSGGNH